MQEQLIRINVAFDPTELEALARMAEAECRPTREQVRYLVRQEAVKRGLLTETGAQPTTTRREEVVNASVDR